MTPFNSKIKEKDNIQLPTLGNSNLVSNNKGNFTNYTNTYKSLYMSVNDTDKRINILGRRITGISQKKIDEEITEKILDKNNPITNANNKQSFISKLIRKQTVNLDEKNNFNKISTKLLNGNVIKYNKLKKELKKELKDLNKRYELFNNKVNVMEEEKSQCQLFIENKIDNWVLRSQNEVQIFNDKEKLEYNIKENINKQITEYIQEIAVMILPNCL